MSRRTIIITIEILLAVLAIVFVTAIMTGNIDISGLFPKDSSASENPALSERNIASGVDTPDIPRTSISASVSYTGGVARVRETITMDSPRTGFKAYFYARNFARVDVLGVTADVPVTGFDTDGFVLTVKSDRPVTTVTLNYDLAVPRGTAIMQAGDDLAVLSNFLAIPQVIENGKPMTPYLWSFGDPYIYDMYNYTVEVDCPDSLRAYAPGQTDVRNDNGRAFYAFSASNLRDFPLVLCSDKVKVTEENTGGVIIRYIGASDAAAFVEHALQFAAKNIGPYPYREFFVVRAPLYPNNGMELSCMILLSDSSFASVEGLKSLTYHEVLHQWFYGIIGTNQLDEPFLDEGLVTMLSYLIRYNVAVGAENTTFLGRPLNSYRTKLEYDQTAYMRASAYFAALCRELGEENFISGLKRVYTEYGFSRVSFAQFMDVMRRGLP